MVQQLLVCLIFLFTSLISSTFGFGFSMIAIPLLSMILVPKLAIPLTIFLSLFLCSWLVYLTYSEMEFKKIINLVIGSVLGIPLGVKILDIVKPEMIKISVNALIIVTVFILTIKKNHYRKFSNERGLGLLIGFLSGFLGSSTGISGPPIIIFGLSQKWEKEKFRANLIGYFTIWAVFTNINYFAMGIIDVSEFVGLITPGLIGMGLGAFAGKKIFKHIKPDNFFSNIQVLIAVIACLGLIEVFLDFITVSR